MSERVDRPNFASSLAQEAAKILNKLKRPIEEEAGDEETAALDTQQRFDPINVRWRIGGVDIEDQEVEEHVQLGDTVRFFTAAANDPGLWILDPTEYARRSGVWEPDPVEFNVFDAARAHEDLLNDLDDPLAGIPDLVDEDGLTVNPFVDSAVSGLRPQRFQNSFSNSTPKKGHYQATEMAYTKKRKTPSKKGGKKKGLSSTKADLLGYMNPFPDMDARIPDGKVVASLPKRYVNVNEINFDEGTLGHILVYPGLRGGYMYFQTTTTGGSATTPQYVYFNDSTEAYVGVTFEAPTGTPAATKDLQGNAIFKMLGDVSNWRTVSQGLRIAMSANDDLNGGWFETCHLHYKLKLSDWELYSPGDAVNHSGTVAADGTSTLEVDGVNMRLRPKTSILSNYLSNANSLAEIDGYALGTLRSIAATSFTLPIFQGEHDFTRLDQNYQIGPSQMSWNALTLTTGAVGPQDVTLSFSEAGNADAKDLWLTQMDTTHDLIYIRIHPSFPTVFGDQTALLVQHVCNQEIVYDPDAVLHRHMTKAPPVDKDFAALRTQKAGHVQAVKTAMRGGKTDIA